MRLLRISHRITLALTAFTLPLAFTLFAIVSEQNIAIRFAAKEVLGAGDLAAAAPAQGALIQAALRQAKPDAAAATALQGIDSGPDGLDVAKQKAAVLDAIGAAGDPAVAIVTARAKLRDLITGIGDRSNLILDNVLATYYLTDVVLNRLPDVLDRVADLALFHPDAATDLERQTQRLIALGALIGGLEGMDTSLEAAEQAEGGAAIKQSLDQPYRVIRERLKAFVTDQQAGKGTAEQARVLVDGIVALTVTADGRLRSLLEERVDGLRHEQVRIVGLAAGFFFLAVGITLLVTRRYVTMPLGKMTQAMSALAGGNLATEVPCVARRDELGAMAGAMQVFKQSTLRARELEQEAAESAAIRAAEVEEARRRAEAQVEIADQVVAAIGAGIGRLALGDLSQRVETVLPAAYERLRADLNAATEQMRSLIGGIVANTDALGSGIDEVAAASNDLSQRTEQQAAGLEQTVAALSEITSQVKSTARGAVEARELMTLAKSDAERSGEVVGNAISAMAQISESSSRIGTIIGVIDEIAFQTSLLALNAGVEAARAGDAGRGFAVVASEVRGLSQRSAEAAREIKALIATSTKHVDAGVKLVDESGTALGRIVERVGAINQVIATIAGSAREQSSALGEINLAMQQMDMTTQQNAAMVEESTAACQALTHVGHELSKMTGKFRLGDRAAGPRLPAAA